MTDTNMETNTDAVRTCANCACFARMLMDGSVLERDAALPPGAEALTVCRRNTPGARQVQAEVPAHNPRTGEPLMDMRTNKQRMERATVMQIGYPFTLPTATCFDGWRSLGTLPGERISSAELERLADMARRLAASVMGPPPTLPPPLNARPVFYRDYDGT